ncbi:ABC transporter ATP-binding protein, partial [Singulisphaera rosea]
MSLRHRITSRLRFAEYRREWGDAAQVAPTESATKNRSLPRLYRELYQVLEGHRLSIVGALVTLSIATLLKLAPPAATKLVIDDVLLGRPSPSSFLGHLPLPESPKGRLLFLVGSVLVVSFVGTALGLWG